MSSLDLWAMEFMKHPLSFKKNRQILHTWGLGRLVRNLALRLAMTHCDSMWLAVNVIAPNHRGGQQICPHLPPVSVSRHGAEGFSWTAWIPAVRSASQNAGRVGAHRMFQNYCVTPSCGADCNRMNRMLFPSQGAGRVSIGNRKMLPQWSGHDVWKCWSAQGWKALPVWWRRTFPYITHQMLVWRTQ